jgi:hypothetical protein
MGRESGMGERGIRRNGMSSNVVCLGYRGRNGKQGKNDKARVSQASSLYACFDRAPEMTTHIQ